MAEQKVASAFFNHPELQQFLLHDAHLTEREVGRGAYGNVVEVEIPGVVCVAKRIHEELLKVANPDEVRYMTDKFISECQLLSSLRHPHIVQFLGLCPIPGSVLPALVMEQLDRCLHSFLESTPNIPLCAKISILHDVAKGLVYMHRHKPVLIHRDLTARNVLLTPSMVAKISDLGMARIIDIPPGQLANTMTRAPGNIVYMPPEAHERDSKYNAKLDIFSFGNLALFTLTQTFPELNAPTYCNRDCNQLVARSEIERRSDTMSLLQKELGKEPQMKKMVVMVHSCLQNLPDRRPSATQLLDTLSTLHQETVNKIWIMNKMEMMLNITEKERELEEKMATIQGLQKEIQTKDEDMTHQEQQFRVVEPLRRLDSFVDSEEVCTIPDDGSINDLVHGTQAEENSESLCEHTRSSQDEMPIPDEEPKPKSEAIATGKVENMTIRWKKTTIQPHKISPIAKAVTVNDRVYINDFNTVRVYSFKTNEWDTLPKPQTEQFSITVVNNTSLVLIGGNKNVNGKKTLTKTIAVWDNGWSYPYPSMPTARALPSVATYKHYIIVVGGATPGLQHSTVVEILDTKACKWYTAKSTPIPCINMDAIVSKDLLYLVGGICALSSTLKFDNKLLAVSLPSLIAEATSTQIHSTWEIFPDTPLTGSAFILTQNKLLSVGGIRIYSKVKAFLKAQRRFEVKDHIYCFDPETRSWLLTDHFQFKCKNPLGIALSRDKILVLSRDSHQLKQPTDDKICIGEVHIETNNDSDFIVSNNTSYVIVGMDEQ